MPKQLNHRYRVCFYATTFQADIHSFARYLDSHPNYTIMIAMENPKSFEKEAVQHLFPIQAPMLDRRKKSTLLRLKAFRPHVIITDNHFPPLRIGKKLMVLWHGLGWRFDNLSGEFEHVHNNIQRLVGSGRIPNRNFIWQCYGPEDRDYRRDYSGFAEENLRILGSAQADDLVNLKINKDKVASYYTVDIRKMKNVLLGFTWHHGRVFSHWGNDVELYRELFEFGKERGINFIVRMHDSFRYEKEYLNKLRNLEKEYDNVMLKFKDIYQDNLIDMMISDVMVSNYSSLINRFYFTGKPSIHVFPYAKSQEGTGIWRKLEKGKLTVVKLSQPTGGWKFSPDMIGGIRVDSMEELKHAIIYSLDNPDCCLEKSREFVEKHMGGADGHNCERIERELRALIEGQK